MKNFDQQVVIRNKRISEVEETDESYYKDFKDFILKNNHPCLMAQAVVKASHITFRAYEAFDEMHTTHQLKEDLDCFVNDHGEDSNQFHSFVAVFPDFRIYDELDFERLLWRRLQFIHDIDTAHWDEGVSADPENPTFSFSIAGKAFYVIGMHPYASRLSRQAPLPTMVFNFHHQFESLRKNKVYKEVRNKVRHRDYMMQGSLNPMLEDFGQSSEARQYSGRAVEESWKCPFRSKA